MNKILLSFLSIILFCISGKLLSQTYQLAGNPVNTTGWTLVSPAVVNTDFVQLTPDTNNQSGSIRLNDPINLKYCDKWRVEFDFRMDSNQTYNGDGIAFWYLANPPVASVLGSGIGVSQNAVGFIVGFDTFNNSTGSSGMSKVHVAYGLVQNTTDTNNVEFFNTPGSSFHSADLNSTQPFQGTTYKHVEVSSQVDPANPANWIVKILLDGVVICNQSFAPAGAAATMTVGYFGFSASTGGARSRHSIKNVKVYMDKVALNKTTVTDTFCPNPTTGFATTNLTSYNSQFVTTPSNYTFTYIANGTTVTNPTNFQFNANTTVNVIVKDNSAILCDNPDGKIQLNLSPFTANNVTISECNNNNATTATFNLNNAPVTSVAGVVKKYYRTLADLTANVNEITTPNAYVSVPGKVYVKVTTPQGCTGNAEITLSFLPLPVSTDASLQSCFIEENPTTASFNLGSANVSTEAGITKKYYVTLNDALDNTNAIVNSNAYVSGNGEVYVRITGVNSCYIIKKIRLNVIAPVTSSVLKDKTICIDDKTTLDAGSGFASYEWSTGETTQSIQNVPVGIYWVKLKTGNCITKQIVKVNAAADPVITSLDITNKRP